MCSSSDGACQQNVRYISDVSSVVGRFEAVFAWVFGRGCSWLGPQVQIKKCLVVLGMHGSVCASLQNRLNAMNTSVMSIQLYGYTPEAVSTFYER